MRGWILLALLIITVYFFATETNELDKPIAQTHALLKGIQDKIHAMTGTKIIRVENNTVRLKNEITRRLSDTEFKALDKIFKSPATIQTFKRDYCGTSTTKHEIFSRDNLYLICDKLI